jgi:pimeloyl-ACP methyl ester carboxylesterase
MPEGPVAGGVEPGIIAALEKIGPAIVVAHSAAGTMGGRIANEKPQLFKALIGIEPQGDCNLPPEIEVKGLARVPTLSIHGINQVGRPQTGPCLETYDKIKKAAAMRPTSHCRNCRARRFMIASRKRASGATITS